MATETGATHSNVMMKRPMDPTTEVVRRIIEYIRNEELVIGDRLPAIRQLAQEWDMGRNVIRDGMLRAQTLGLIRLHARSGAFVQTLDLSSLVNALADTLDIALAQEKARVSDLMISRRVIEVELAGKAASNCRVEDAYHLKQLFSQMLAGEEEIRQQLPDAQANFLTLDETFHQEIARIAGNSVLLTIQRALLALLRPWRITEIQSDAKIERTRKCHESILQCIVDHDSEGAQAAMHKHLSYDWSQPSPDTILP